MNRAHTHHIRIWLSLLILTIITLSTQACAKQPSGSHQTQQPDNKTTTNLVQSHNLPDFTQLVHKSAPAVVSITGVRTIKMVGPGNKLFLISHPIVHSENSSNTSSDPTTHLINRLKAKSVF